MRTFARQKNLHMPYTEYPSLDLPGIAGEVQAEWEVRNTFAESVSSRPAQRPFVFFEGPPSANGMPGIHHVMARTIKDIFCRYKTLKGYRVERRAGWDTHGLPIELGVEKELGITKEDIGKTITVEAYNEACRKAVMRYTDVWNDLTRRMGYWVDMDKPYITYTNKYMESVWWLLQQLYRKNLLYKGYTIQPYSPAAGTGLSSHELNQPGTYRDVKDTSATALFSLLAEGQALLARTTGRTDLPYYIMAWTTTPWTLPANTALAVNPGIPYAVVETFNQYTHERVAVVLAQALVPAQFSGKYQPAEADEAFAAYTPEQKHIPYRVLATLSGNELTGLPYSQLLPYVQPMEGAEKAFKVIPGTFVTTEDGTGVVHIAPTFGSDDAQVARENDIPAMLVPNEHGDPAPIVDLQGKYVKQMGELAGMYVKNEYYPAGEAPEKSVDVLISIKLKEAGKAFRIEKYEHSYPHCWRTDKPVLYYPLDSWFVRSTAAKERMIALNKTIQWKPESTGTGRFGNWLENLNDWNLSRSRFWGIPIPIWRTADGSESLCIGSVAELKEACAQAAAAGLMPENPLAHFDPTDMSDANYDRIDLHKHQVDRIVLLSPNGKPMHREADLIDVWFDSGAMPYAQWHYPFENREKIDQGLAFPADFIAEGVDQTRGWFYTLHAIAVLCFDSVAYKTVVSNGLVLDKNGQKMSKRLGNAVDPFETIAKYGPDATRWYMITNAQPWDNLRFDEQGIADVQRKFFGTLFHTYGFFALYANLDGFAYTEAEVPFAERPEMDRWILSRLHSLCRDVNAAYDEYEPTRAGRLIQSFVDEELSNWYVRLCRRRFWKGEYGPDKVSAYQTLYTCLEWVAIMASPIAPFYMERLFNDLNSITGRHSVHSVHLAHFPEEGATDTDLERRMEIARRISSLVLGLRKIHKVRVRQPLAKVMIPIPDPTFERQLHDVEHIILSEVNVKQMVYLTDTKGVFVKDIKADFKKLGARLGKDMKEVAAKIAAMGQNDIAALEKTGMAAIHLSDGRSVDITRDDVSITTRDIPGYTLSSDGELTVALDLSIDEALRSEGIARELVNRIQNLRKDSGLEVTDRIRIQVQESKEIARALSSNLDYICAEVLADSVELVQHINSPLAHPVEIETGLDTLIVLQKV
jgi:isoleucyl-tRNA synthetase